MCSWSKDALGALALGSGLGKTRTETRHHLGSERFGTGEYIAIHEAGGIDRLSGCLGHPAVVPVAIAKSWNSCLCRDLLLDHAKRRGIGTIAFVMCRRRASDEITVALRLVPAECADALHVVQ